jgi:hypothetical protein
MPKAKGSKSGGSGKSKSSAGGKYRSAISGKYVSARYAKTHPKTTVKESTQR